MFFVVFSLLISPTTRAAATNLFRPVQISSSAGREHILLSLDRATLSQLLQTAQKGDHYSLFLPGGPVEFRFEYRVIDARKDLDCCSLALRAEKGEAIVRLDRELEVRDFTARYEGVDYRYREVGSGNFEVLGPAIPNLPPDPLR